MAEWTVSTDTDHDLSLRSWDVTCDGRAVAYDLVSLDEVADVIEHDWCDGDVVEIVEPGRWVVYTSLVDLRDDPGY